LRFPEIAYQRWFKEGDAAGARFDLAGSGVPAFPAARLPLRRSDFSTHHPPGYGWPPLVEALAERYRVDTGRVVPVTGGASLANWLACAAALEGSDAATEVIVERPAYEPLRRIPESFGCRVRRLDRRHARGWTVDLERLAALVGRRTRLLVLTDLHNPSGAALDRGTLRAAAAMLERVGGWVLVVEVYGETLWDETTDSVARLAPNVVATNSLTKAYGLDGLRAGWLLAPPELARRAWRIHDHLGVNPVATADRMALVALRNLSLLRARVAHRLAANRRAWRSFLAGERRLASVEPAGGTVAFPRLPAGLDGDAFAAHLLARHSTRVVPGSFFEAPRHFRIGFTASGPSFRAGLERIATTLDELAGR
jgi:aspartate/methionine/tyrosine aminotransferase